MSKKTSPAKAAEKKPVVSPKMAAKALNLRELYLSLTEQEKAAVVHFFNLHNNAGWIYNEFMSDNGRSYIDQQVQYSQELAALEQGLMPADVVLDSPFSDDNLKDLNMSLLRDDLR